MPQNTGATRLSTCASCNQPYQKPGLARTSSPRPHSISCPAPPNRQAGPTPPAAQPSRKRRKNVRPTRLSEPEVVKQGPTPLPARPDPTPQQPILAAEQEKMFVRLDYPNPKSLRKVQPDQQPGPTRSAARPNPTSSPARPQNKKKSSSDKTISTQSRQARGPTPIGPPRHSLSTPSAHAQGPAKVHPGSGASLSPSPSDVSFASGISLCTCARPCPCRPRWSGTSRCRRDGCLRQKRQEQGRRNKCERLPCRRYNRVLPYDTVQSCNTVHIIPHNRVIPYNTVQSCSTL